MPIWLPELIPHPFLQLSNFPRLAITILVVIFFSGCKASNPPSQSWEVAVKGLYSGALSDRSNLSIVGSITHGASLWRIEDQERLFNWNHQSGESTNVIAAAFSPEGKFAFTTSHQTMVLWKTDTGKAVTYWTAPSEVLSVALTPNATYALLGLINHNVVLYDVKRGGIERTFYHKNRVRSVALSSNGKLAVSGSEDETAKLWDVQKGELLHTWRHDNEVRLVAISADGGLVISVSKYDKAVLWNTNSGDRVGIIPLKEHQLKRGLTFTAAKFSADSSLLLTGNSDRLVQLWDIKTLKELQRWELPKRDPWKPTGVSVVALSFAEDHNQFYVMASNGFIHQLTRSSAP